jgi:hypothetical protein
MDKNSIITYIMTTPHNTNWNVLSTMLGAGDWSKLKAYVETTPYNMNRKILEAFFGDSAAIVCEAKVCEAVVG